MKLIEALKGAQAMAVSQGLEMAVVEEGPHTSEFETRPSYGYAPMEAKDTIYKHATLLFQVAAGGQETQAVTASITQTQLQTMRKWIDRKGHNGGNFATVAKTLALIEVHYEGGLVGFLTQEPEPVNSPDILSGAMTNAAMIGHLIAHRSADFDLTPEALEEVENAAIELARIEQEAGFEWGNERNNWEDVCDALAGQIVHPDRMIKSYTHLIELKLGR